MGITKFTCTRCEFTTNAPWYALLHAERHSGQLLNWWEFGTTSVGPRRTHDAVKLQFYIDQGMIRAEVGESEGPGCGTAKGAGHSGRGGRGGGAGHSGRGGRGGGAGPSGQSGRGGGAEHSGQSGRGGGAGHSGQSGRVARLSSGISGPPKGVMMAHLDEHVYAHIAPPYDERAECQLLLLPFFHCYGFGLLNIALLKGSTAVVMATFEQDLFCSTVERFKIRVLKIVPPVLVFLAKSAKLDAYDFSHVCLLFSGAAPAGNDLLAEIKRRFPHIQIVQSYGMTEMAVAICLPVLDKERHEPVGKLVANLEMKIVDISTREELLERGMPGELVVRGPTVMRGYLGRPKEAAQLVDSEGWLSTGDIAFVDNEGFVHIVDRLKELIKVNGLQVSPSELEDLLLSHPLVQDCAVIGVPDAISGELPMAFIVRKGGGTGVGEEDVQQFVRENAVYYKHLKGGVEFVEHIPKSPSGKILRRVLRERVAKRRANHLMKSKI